MTTERGGGTNNGEEHATLLTEKGKKEKKVGGENACHFPHTEKEGGAEINKWQLIFAYIHSLHIYSYVF